MSRKILMSFLSLALASCSALPSNQSYVSGSASFDQVNTSAVSQYEREMLAKSLANPYANSVADVDNSYKSLSLAKENTKFGVKSTVVSDERAVIVKVGKLNYTLSESFMNKLRAVAQDTGYTKTVAGGVATDIGAELTTGAFTRLSAPASVNAIAIDANNPNLVVAPTAVTFTSTYTLTASEAAFVALIKTYKSVSMPNYFGANDTTPASTTPVPARLDELFFIINTTNVSDAFYKALHTAVITGTLGVLDAAEITALNTTPIVHGTAAAAVPTLAEKAFLTSIVNANPYSAGVVSLDSTGKIVVDDISLYYGDIDVPGTATNVPAVAPLTAPTTLQILLANYGKLSRVSTTQPIATVVGTNYIEPLSTTNYSGASAVVVEELLTTDDLGVIYTAANTAAIASAGLTGAASATYTYADLHNTERAIHMQYAPVGAPVAPITAATPPTKFNTAASIASLSFGVLAAPSVPAFTSVPNYNNIPVLSSEYGTLGTALATGGGATLTKIGKTAAATFKNKAGILGYLSATIGGGGVPTFIVPCTRSATGAIALSTIGTNYVVITAVTSSLGSYDFYMVDTGYNSASGLSYSFLGNSNGGAVPTAPLNAVISGLYNYAGTIVAAK